MGGQIAPLGGASAFETQSFIDILWYPKAIFSETHVFLAVSADFDLEDAIVQSFFKCWMALRPGEGRSTGGFGTIFRPNSQHDLYQIKFPYTSNSRLAKFRWYHVTRKQFSTFANSLRRF